ncbi:hypothetical protein BJX68DRAFT_238903 [Aspergillus pseudodeflectus]|uniref:Uncharacterized protein n=1 Tax=Aspergillus pseudodeflectus TaxID=176178 RepID=A0ABR4K7W6_9EURO
MSILRSIKGAIHVHEHSERQGVDSEDESGVVIWPGPIYLRIRLTGAASNLFVGLPCTQSLPRDSFLFKMIQFELSEAVRSRYQIPLNYRPRIIARCVGKVRIWGLVRLPLTCRQMFMSRLCCIHRRSSNNLLLLEPRIIALLLWFNAIMFSMRA